MAAPLAPGVDRLGTESAFSVLARARELEASGRDIVHLEIGEPDFPTPAHISEAASAAIRSGATHYCPSAGLPELREAAAVALSATRGIDVPAARVLVGNGAKPLLFFTILATCGPGDEVVYPDPGFPIYESAIRWTGATPVPLPLHEAADFSFDVDELAGRLSERTALVILNSPQNPTGGVVPAGALEAAAERIAATPAWVLSDEVYARMTYDGPAASIASVPGMLDRTVLLDGFSKTYAMTGWRLGYGVMPVPLAEQVAKLQVNSNSCTAAATQYAGLAALRGPQDGVERMLTEFRARRDLIVAGLNELPGVECIAPQGAFYAFPRVAGTGLSADALADLLLQEAGVACLSGTAFGRHGEGHLRFSYANSRENIVRAVERMEDVLARAAAR